LIFEVRRTATNHDRASRDRRLNSVAVSVDGSIIGRVVRLAV
jgi:hypothetical protein